VRERSVRIGVLFLAAAFIACAATVTFDFETTSATFLSPSPAPGGLDNLILNPAAGLIFMTITRQSGDVFDISENSGIEGGKPAGWGRRSLDPNAASFNATAFILDFSRPIRSISVEYGDYGGDDDFLSLVGYTDPGGTGVVKQSVLDHYGVSAFPKFNTASLLDIPGDPGFRSVLVIGGDLANNPNSVYYDNFVVTFNDAPEPATLYPVLGGLLLGLLRRKTRPHGRDTDPIR
jgi:hypothetical protein